MIHGSTVSASSMFANCAAKNSLLLPFARSALRAVGVIPSSRL